MESVININIKRLPSGDYLATSKNFMGLKATGKTIEAALISAKEMIKKLLIR